MNISISLLLALILLVASCRNADKPIVDNNEHAALISVGYIDSIITFKCTLDTTKGLLYWHSPNIDYNEGQMWDTGYVVDICGAMGIWGDPYVIPGKMILHRQYSDDDGKTWVPFDQEMNKDAKFYDSEWNEIPHENVYCLIVTPTHP
jgi:hypothetical protein